MLAKRIIPCLDVKDGRVVKGINFLNLQDAGDPVEQARYYDAHDADELVYLDITASAEKRDILIDVVRRTAEQVFMPLTVGGGVRTPADEHGSRFDTRPDPGLRRSFRQSGNSCCHRCPGCVESAVAGRYLWRPHRNRTRCPGMGPKGSGARRR